MQPRRCPLTLRLTLALGYRRLTFLEVTQSFGGGELRVTRRTSSIGASSMGLGMSERVCLTRIAFSLERR